MYTHQMERPRCCVGNCTGFGAITKKSKNGYQLFSKYCNHHRNSAYHKKFNYRNHKKDHCEQCGFVATHPAQLDVDHIDGNKKNTCESNLQTLCANCHRLKTVTMGDHLPG